MNVMVGYPVHQRVLFFASFFVRAVQIRADWRQMASNHQLVSKTEVQ